MAVRELKDSSAEKRNKRAKSIAAMGLVNRDGDLFRVSTPSLRGRQTSFEVRRDESGKIRCNCLEFEEAVSTDSKFRCEHILAVKYALLEKNTESVTKKPVRIKTEIKVKSEPADTQDENATELRLSERSEQKADEVREDVPINGRIGTEENPRRNQLANKRGKNKM